MKKCRTSILARSQTAWLLKFLRIMKLTTFLFLIGTIQVFATGSYAQSTDLTLNLGETNVGEVLLEIESQSEFYFLFNQLFWKSVFYGHITDSYCCRLIIAEW